MSKQSSIEWFLNEFSKRIEFVPESELDKWYKELIPKAKAMHKEEIIESYCQGCLDMNNDDTIFPRETSEQYYNQIFGGEQ